jgi:putative FmdB family regulatory protein
MPTYEYECPEHGIFEEYHSIKIKLEHCPQCQAAGKEQEVKRLISLGGKGVVELTGHDLVAKTKEDIVKLKSDMSKSDKVYANMLGDDKYHALQTKMDKNKQERGKNR